MTFRFLMNDKTGIQEEAYCVLIEEEAERAARKKEREGETHV